MRYFKEDDSIFEIIICIINENQVRTGLILNRFCAAITLYEHSSHPLIHDKTVVNQSIVVQGRDFVGERLVQYKLSFYITPIIII